RVRRGRGPYSATGTDGDGGCGERARSSGRHTAGPVATGRAADPFSRVDGDAVRGVRLRAGRDPRSDGGAAQLRSPAARSHTHPRGHGTAFPEIGARSGHGRRRRRGPVDASSVLAVHRGGSGDRDDVRRVVGTTHEVASLTPDAWTSNQEICLRS